MVGATVKFEVALVGMWFAVGLVLSAYVAVLAARRFLIPLLAMALILCWTARASVINGFYQQHRAGRACTLYLARRGGWAWGAGAGGLCGNVLGIYRGTGMFPVWVSPRIDAVDY